MLQPSVFVEATTKSSSEKATLGQRRRNSICIIHKKGINRPPHRSPAGAHTTPALYTKNSRGFLDASRAALYTIPIGCVISADFDFVFWLSFFIVDSFSPFCIHRYGLRGGRVWKEREQKKVICLCSKFISSIKEWFQASCVRVCSLVILTVWVFVFAYEMNWA